MSTPTPGPDFSKGGAPEGQQGWSAPQQEPGYPPQQGYSPQQGHNPQQGHTPAPGYDPAPSYTGGPAGYGAPTGRRPGIVTAAAVVGIVWGALGALLGLLVMVAAFGLGAALAGLITLISVAFSVAMLVGGVFVLQGKSPKLLLYVSYVAIALGVISLIISLATTGGSAFNGVLGFIVPGVIIALLLNPQTKQYFAARGHTY
jgi:hypothetical protein